jgi:hypothetical protein
VIAAKVQLLRWRLAGGEGSDAETRFERKNISVKGARRRGRGGLIAPVHVVASKIASISRSYGALSMPPHRPTRRRTGLVTICRQRTLAATSPWPCPGAALLGR